MNVRPLSQEQADALMKSLEGSCESHFLDAFHAERRHPRGQRWALPDGKRLYYRVESYLFGINCAPANTLCLSSFARIDAAHPDGTCAMCLKFLIEDRLIPLCHAQYKTHITAVLTGGGARVFRELRSIFPGVRLGSGAYGIGLIDLARPGLSPSDTDTHPSTSPLPVPSPVRFA